MSDIHKGISQTGSDICVCGATMGDPIHDMDDGISDPGMTVDEIRADPAGGDDA